MPVHSSAMSTPSSFHGSFAGSRSRGDLDLAVAEVDRVAVDRHRAGEAAVHDVVAQQMGVGLDRAEIVDGDDLDVLAAGFDDGAQDIAADAAKSVDGDPNSHVFLLLMSSCHPRGGMSHPRRCLRRIARFGQARTDHLTVR